ncbi:MAG: YdcF family protein, partial [Anaerolineae bacterium]
IVFVKPDPQPADLLFVFGTSVIDEQTLQQISQDVANGFYPWIMVTGLVGRAYYETGQPVAHFLRDKFIAGSIPTSKILVQDRSTNTLEDLQFSLEILEKQQIHPQHIAFLSKAHHSGRCFLTMRRFFPNLPLYPITYTAEYDGVPVAPENWTQHPAARNRVYGEYLRIIKYAGRGDIAALELK